MRPSFTTISSIAMHSLSRFTPRINTIWVYIGWHRTPTGEIFTDNTKYLFLHVCQEHPEITSVWLAKSQKVAREIRAEGLIAHYQFSILGMYYALRAGVTIIDAYLHEWNYAFAGKTKLVQLLHGKGMKKKGYVRPNLLPHSLICYPSPEVVEMISDSFSRGAVKVVTGYSRSDIITSDNLSPTANLHVDTETIDQIKNLHSKGSTVLWYAPTFRRDEKMFSVETVLDLENLHKTLVAKKIYLYISLHPKYRNEGFPQKKYTNVRFFAQQDFFPLYKHVDILITDYSSSFTDFLLVDKPIIFYPFDLDTYREKEGVIINYDQETPGIKANDALALRQAIESVLEFDAYKEQRRIIRNRYHEYQDGHNAKRTYNAIIQNLARLQ